MDPLPPDIILTAIVISFAVGALLPDRLLRRLPRLRHRQSRAAAGRRRRADARAATAMSSAHPRPAGSVLHRDRARAAERASAPRARAQRSPRASGSRRTSSGCSRYVDTHGIQVIDDRRLRSRPTASPSSPTGSPASCSACRCRSARSCSPTRCFTRRPRRSSGYFFHPLFQVLLLGVNWSFITGDLFNLFVAYEVMLIGSYGSMMVGASRAAGAPDDDVHRASTCVGGDALRRRHRRSSTRCVGTLNMADLAAAHGRSSAGTRAAMRDRGVDGAAGRVRARRRRRSRSSSGCPTPIRSCPPGVNGYFAGLLTKVGVYSLLRVFVHDASGRTATSSRLRRAARAVRLHDAARRARRALPVGDPPHPLVAHHQPGRLHGDGHRARRATPAIAPAAVAATIFYVVHHIVVKSSLFLIGGRRRARSPARSELQARWAACSTLAPGRRGALPRRGALARRHAAVLGLLRQARADPRGSRRTASSRSSLVVARHQLPHAALDDEDLDRTRSGARRARRGAARALARDWRRRPRCWSRRRSLLGLWRAAVPAARRRRGARRGRPDAPTRRRSCCRRRVPAPLAAARGERGR